MVQGLEASDFVALASGRRGHFRLESGYHAGLWLDLDTLFAEPRRVMPFVTALVDRLRPYDVDAVCGPMLGGAFLAQLVAGALDVEFCFTERHEPADDGAMFAVQYRLRPAFHARVAGRRVAMVDDVMSAGSALRGTHAELLADGAVPVVAGALLVLGSMGADYFRQHGVAVESVAHDSFDLWPPAECPLCADGIPAESLVG